MIPENEDWKELIKAVATQPLDTKVSKEDFIQVVDEVIGVFNEHSPQFTLVYKHGGIKIVSRLYPKEHSGSVAYTQFISPGIMTLGPDLFKASKCFFSADEFREALIKFLQSNTFLATLKVMHSWDTEKANTSNEEQPLTESSMMRVHVAVNHEDV